MTITQLLQSTLRGQLVTCHFEGKPFGPIRVEDIRLEPDGSLVIHLPLGYIRYPSLAGMDFEIAKAPKLATETKPRAIEDEPKPSVEDPKPVPRPRRTEALK